MAFKGEIALGMLNTLVMSKGIADGDVYRVQGPGQLEPNAYPVENGDFVQWSTPLGGWKATAMKYATSQDVFSTAVALMDTKLQEDETIEGTGLTYQKDKFYVFGDLLYYCTSATTTKAEFAGIGGVAAALNYMVEHFGLNAD